MDRRIDRSNLNLDQAAAMVAARSASWRTLGLIVDELTWMDNDAPWPEPLLTDRRLAHRPKSLGIRLHNGTGAAVIIFYAAGWVDVDLLLPNSNETVAEYVELDDVEEFGPLLDSLIARLITTA